MTRRCTHPTLLHTARGLAASLLLFLALAPALGPTPHPHDCADHRAHIDHLPLVLEADVLKTSPAPLEPIRNPQSEIRNAGLWDRFMDWASGEICVDCNHRTGGALGGDRCGCDEPGGSG